MDLTYAFVRSRKVKTLIPRHSHPKYEFVYFFSGKGVLEYDAGTIPFSRGTYYVMKSDTLHSELYENTGISLVIQFMPPLDRLKIGSAVSDDTILNLGPVCEQIRQELKEKRFGYEIIVDSLMREIITLIARMQHVKSSITNNGLRDAVLYIDQYFMSNIRIGDLAKDCGYTADHFCCLFKKQTRYTPKQYILAKRLRLAKKLLKENKLSIKEIAVRCGFESYSQFMTFFKKHTGTTPNGYRGS